MYLGKYEGLGVVGDIAEDMARIWGEPESWFIALSNLQNDIIKTGSLIGGVTAEDWNIVQKYFNEQFTIRNPMFSGFRTLMLKHDPLMNAQRIALKRLTLTSTRRPSEANISSSKLDLKLLKQNVGKFTFAGPMALGGRYGMVIATRDGLRDVIEKNLEKSTFQSPEERGIRAGIKELEERFSMGLIFGGVGLVVVAALVGLYLIKK